LYSSKFPLVTSEKLKGNACWQPAGQNVKALVANQIATLLEVGDIFGEILRKYLFCKKKV
jgi:hypothetical protein